MFKLIYKWTDKIKEKVASLSDKMSEKGQGMVEYAMILAAVAVVAVLVLWKGTDDQSLIGSIKKAFGGASTNITSATTSATTTMNATGQ